ncbi:cytochrome P450, partial [Zopfochytrium polystomum]
PDVLKKIRQEVDEIAGHSTLTFDTVKDLNYLTAVIHEILCLYPTVHITSRCARIPDTLPRGVSIPAQTRVVQNIYAMNRGESLWGLDAASFNTERVKDPSADDGGAATLRRVSPFRWPVFNAGPRSCLGQTMATFQAVWVMATVLQRFLRCWTRRR